MRKKFGMLAFLVILPIILIQIYAYYFEFAGNLLEEYRSPVKLGLLIISILSTFWLVVISKKDGSKVWFWSMVILLVLLLLYLYMAIAILSMTFSF